MLKNPFPLNSFHSQSASSNKNLWLKLTKKHFEDTNFELGLKKCFNKIDELFYA